MAIEIVRLGAAIETTCLLCRASHTLLKKVARHKGERRMEVPWKRVSGPGVLETRGACTDRGLDLDAIASQEHARKRYLIRCTGCM